MGRGRRALALVAVLAGFVSAAAPALADSYESVVARAVAARDRALETDAARDWQEALELFAVAVDLSPSKETKFEFAEAAARLHFDDEAFAAYTDALALGLEARAAEVAQAFVTAHAGTFASLSIVGPAGARVYVNDRKRCVLPLAGPLPVMPGPLRVSVSAPSYRPWERQLDVPAGVTEAVPVALELELEKASPARATRAPLPLQPAPALAPARPRWGLPVLIAGGGLVLAGSAGIVATSALLPSRRRVLSDNCLSMVGERCAYTNVDSADAAQSAANDIATLQTLRWVSVGTAVVGVGAVTAGLVRLASGRGEVAPRVPAELYVSPERMSLSWRAEF